MNALKNADPASFSLDGIEWKPCTDEQAMVGVDYTSRHAYQATINDLVYVLTSRSTGYTDQLHWWCGARHLTFQRHIGAHDTALDAARYVAAAFAENPEHFLLGDD